MCVIGRVSCLRVGGKIKTWYLIGVVLLHNIVIERETKRCHIAPIRIHLRVILICVVSHIHIFTYCGKWGIEKSVALASIGISMAIEVILMA